LNALTALAEDAADGAQTHEVAIGLKQNKEADIRTDLTDVLTRIATHATAVGAKPALSAAVRTADSNGKAFIATARDVLVPPLGGQWSEAWAPTGFPNQSLAVPRTQPERQSLLASLRDYFTANPAKENAPLGITAALAATRFTAFSDGRSGFNQGVTLTGQLIVARDASAKKLTKRMRGLVDELTQLLEDDDPIWYAFGFNPPAAPETPDQVEGLVVTPGDGNAFADWEDTPRADRYHVEIQIVGVDTDFRRVATVTESDATITGLAAGQTVRVRVLAVNDAGDGPPSAVLEITMPVTP
jgi:hypothetical protein